MGYEMLIKELLIRKEKIQDYLLNNRYNKAFRPQHIYDSVYSYLKHGGKALRPSVLLFSCGAVGGDEDKMIPAGAAVEIFHTWTIVHDDIIDRDDKRRGGLTIHEEFRQKSIKELGYNDQDAVHYGISIAILAGDIMQGWAVAMMSELAQNGVDPALVLYLIGDSEIRVQAELVEGQVYDIQYPRVSIESLNEEQIMNVMWKKTGVLYEYCGKAGAMLGLNTLDDQHEFVKAISDFTGKCGTAFQLQDDILGVIGDEKTLGKPVGSDIREGKKTIIFHYSFNNANDRQKDIMLKTLGNQQASESAINEVKKILLDLGGVEYTKQLAKSYIENSISHLDIVPKSKYRDLLLMWADYMIEREF
ncbi:TPA: polyprenyl synthetase family protein [bacterium]|nr:polyprenyl synthetase family protein [bacterium]